MAATRLTKDENRIIKEAAEERDMSVATFLRRAALNSARSPVTNP